MFLATSDGISDLDWDVITGCAEAIADASSTEADDTLLVNNLIRELKKLENHYGRLPSILSTEADYIEDKVKELCLLKEAYVTACELDDSKNKAFISASLAEYYVEREMNIERASYWAKELLHNLDKYPDSYLQSVYTDVKKELTQG